MKSLAQNILIAHNIETVIDKLILAIDIYDKTSKRVHFKPMKELFSELKDSKEAMLNALAESTEMNLDDYSISIEEKIKLELEKIGIELDHLIIKNNYNETLSFCIKRERELLNAYEDALNQDLDDSLEDLLKKHHTETLQLLESLVERHESGNFKKW